MIEVLVSAVIILVAIDFAFLALRGKGPRCWRCMGQTDGEAVLLNGLPMHKRCADRIEER